MKMKIWAICLGFLGSFVMLSCQKQSQPTTSNEPKSNSSDSLNTHLYQLDNGLTLIVREDDTAPVASVQAWCAAGSITEGEQLGAGKSHILEHMLFKGTERRGPTELAQEIQSLGGNTNAYTTFNRTVYYIDLPSINWKGALDILVDSMFHSTLPEDEYIKEMEVVRREFAMGFDDPNRTLQKLLFSTAFTKHPYKYPVIGYLELFNTLTRQDMVDYYRENYIPNNLTFIVVGDVDADQVYDELKNLAGSIERGFNPEHILAQEPPQLGMRFVEKPFPTDSRQLSMGFHIPGIADPDLFALDVLAILAGQGASSRLHRELVEEDPIFRKIGAYSYTPEHSGIWGCSATLHPGSEFSTIEAVDRILAELAYYQTNLVSPQQVEKARRQVLSDFYRERQTMSGQAGSLGSSWLLTRELDFDQTYLQGLESVTPQDLREVARKYLKRSNLNVAALYPEQAKEAGTDEISKAEKEKKAREEKKLSQLSWHDQVPLILAPDRKVPLTTVRFTFRGGLLAETAENNGITALLAKMLRQGTENRSRDELAEEIESLGGSLIVEAGNNSVTLGVEVLTQDLEQGLDILSDVIFNPSLDPEALQDQKRKQLTDLSLQKDRPISVASNQLKQSLLGSHPYSLNALGTEESIEAITVDALRQYHQQLLSQESLSISVAGYFDQDSIGERLDTHFPLEKLKGQGLNTTAPSDFRGTGKTEILPTDKVQAIVVLGFPGIDVGHPDRAALTLLNETLSGLSSRLFIRIREEKSLAYFVGTQQIVGPDPGFFIFYAGTRADSSAQVQSEFFEEIKLLTTEGLSQEELERSKAKLFGKRLLQKQTADARAYQASLNVLYGLDLGYEDRLEAQLQSLTTEDILQTAKKYFSEPNFTCIIVQPEE
ncbi:MAG: pitrilysin family protein [Verrucomicrobiota bacterium]